MYSLRAVTLIGDEAIGPIIIGQAESIVAYYRSIDVTTLCIYPVMSGAMYYAPSLMVAMREFSGRPDFRVIKNLSEASGQNLLIVDTIYDTGKTIDELNEALLSMENPPSSVNYSFFCHKSRLPEGNAWMGVRLPEYYVYGFGLDDENGLNRELSKIMYNATS